MIKSKKQMFIVLGVFTLVLMLGTVTYAFFNYTRTGLANTIKVGRVEFTSSQNIININNVFPIDSTEVNTKTDYVGSATIHITGKTTYNDGVEYLVTAQDVENRINDKFIPISTVVDFDNSENKTIGTSDNNYFENRNVNTSSYKVLYNYVNNDGDQLVVGYIKPDQDGIDGTITIKAYIDKSKIAISDTYDPEGYEIVLNSDATNEDINNCATYYEDELGAVISPYESFADYCKGTGEWNGNTIMEDYHSGAIYDERLHRLLQLNILKKVYTDTSGDWVAERTVLTTNEWNSLQTNGISFKIKVEANEGIWVNERKNGTIDSCPNCKFIAPEDGLVMYTAWNTEGETPTEITSGYNMDYNDIVVKTSGQNFFLGVVTNDNNQITTAYGCALYNGRTPFCVELSDNGSTYETNKNIVQSTNLWGNTCEVDDNLGYTNCGLENYESIYVYLDNNGSLEIGQGRYMAFRLFHDGEISCEYY